MEKVRLDAAIQGLKRYQGQPCRVCGNTERFVSNGNCVTCAKEHTRKYQEKIKEIIQQARAGEA